MNVTDLNVIGQELNFILKAKPYTSRSSIDVLQRVNIFFGYLKRNNILRKIPEMIIDKTLQIWFNDPETGSDFDWSYNTYFPKIDICSIFNKCNYRGMCI